MKASTGYQQQRPMPFGPGEAEPAGGALAVERPAATQRAQKPRRRWRALAAALGVAAVGVLLWSNRAQLPASIHALRQARPGFLLLALVVCVLALLNQAAMHQGAQKAVGLSTPFGTAVRAATAAQFFNLVAKSGGMAGVGAFLRARSEHQPRSRVVVAYVLATILGQLGFAVVLGASLAVAWADGKLTLADVVASLFFAAMVTVVLSVVITGMQSRERLRTLLSVPQRLLGAVLAIVGRRSSSEPVSGPSASDDVYEAMQILAQRPLRAARAGVHALGVEVLGALLLWSVLRAVGVPSSVKLAVVAYALSVLFAIVGFLPGGLGFVEAGLGAVLVSYGVAVPVAAAAVVLYRVFELWVPVLIGAWAAQSLAGFSRENGFAARATAWQFHGRHGPIGRTSLRIASVGALGLAAVDVMLAAAHDPILRLGEWHVELAEQTVEGFRYLLLAAALVLASSSRGLLHGKRQAWRWGIAGAAVSLAAHQLKGGDAVGEVAALGLLVLLAVSRPWFRAANDPATARRGALWLLVGEAAVFAYGVGGTYLLDAQFRDPTSVGDALSNAFRLLFVLPAASVDPTSPHGRWFIDSVRVLALAVLASGVARTVRSAVLGPARSDAERAEVLALLEQHATTSLAYFHLLDDKRHLFTADRGGVVSYTVVGAVAVGLGEPVGDPVSCRAAAIAFGRHCERNGWRFCYHQVTPQGAAWLTMGGLRALKIGEEAIVDVASFDVSTPHFKSVRNKTGKLVRDGVHVEELAQPIDGATMAELAEVSQSWLADGGHRERTFTVGRFDPAYLRETTVLVARSPAGRIEAFVNVLPSFGTGEGNFDLMRRRSDAPRNVIDLLFLALIERFRAEGLQRMTLGLAPLANPDGDTLPERALRLLYQRGEAAFHFRGLRDFKAKWQPRWEPRYLVYRSDLELPEVAVAVARAGELKPPADRLRRRVRPLAERALAVARRAWVSALLVGAVVGIQVLAANPAVHRWLMEHLAVSWNDLDAAGFWRLATATFVQDKPGLRLSILLPMAVLPVAERRLGWARTALTFLLGDWLSSLVALSVLRLAGALGVMPAMQAALRSQAGSSSATLAVTAALVVTVSGRKRRISLLGMLAVLLLGSLVLFHRLTEWEHVLAAVTGILLTRLPVRTHAGEQAGPPPAQDRTGLGGIASAPVGGWSFTGLATPSTDARELVGPRQASDQGTSKESA